MNYKEYLHKHQGPLPYPTDTVKFLRSPDIMKNLLSGEYPFGVVGLDIGINEIGEKIDKENKRELSLGEIKSGDFEKFGLRKIETVELFTKNRVKFCLLGLPNIQYQEVSRIYTKYPFLVSLFKYDTRPILYYLQTGGKSTPVPVPPIILDTGGDLELRAANEARETGENILVADIVSTGSTAEKAGLIVKEVLLEVEYILYTSLTTKERLSNFFTSNQTMIGFYAKNEVKDFFTRYFFLNKEGRGKLLEDLEKAVVRNYRYYILNKPVLGRYEDPVDEREGERLIKKEISFLGESLDLLMIENTKMMGETFPVLYDRYPIKLLGILNGEIPFDESTFRDELVQAQKEDEAKETRYRSGALGRLAMVEWGEDLEIAPEIIGEIEKLRKIITKDIS